MKETARHLCFEEIKLVFVRTNDKLAVVQLKRQNLKYLVGNYLR